LRSEAVKLHRNVTDKTGTMQRTRSERSEIRRNPDIDENATEDEASRSQIGAGE